MSRSGHPETGEVVWCDDAGATCRRWNRRQGPHTRLTEETTSAVFLLERLAPTPAADVEKAAAELSDLLEKFSPAPGSPSALPPDPPQCASVARSCSGVGAVPPRWAGIHHVSSAPLGRTG